MIQLGERAYPDESTIHRDLRSKLPIASFMPAMSIGDGVSQWTFSQRHDAVDCDTAGTSFHPKNPLINSYELQELSLPFTPELREHPDWK